MHGYRRGRTIWRRLEDPSESLHLTVGVGVAKERSHHEKGPHCRVRPICERIRSLGPETGVSAGGRKQGASTGTHSQAQPISPSTPKVAKPLVLAPWMERMWLRGASRVFVVASTCFLRATWSQSCRVIDVS